MPFALPGQVMPDHIARRKRRGEGSWGYAPATGGGGYVPPGFQLLMGADGALLKGADGALLYGKAA